MQILSHAGCKSSPVFCFLPPLPEGLFSECIPHRIDGERPFRCPLIIGGLQIERASFRSLDKAGRFKFSKAAAHCPPVRQIKLLCGFSLPKANAAIVGAIIAAGDDDIERPRRWL